MTFQQQKYQVIKKATSYELANFILNYFLLKKDAVRYMYQNNIHAQSPILGTWTDQQIPNTYSCYGDFVMDTLLMKMLPVMKEHSNLDLNNHALLESKMLSFTQLNLLLHKTF